MSESAKLVLEVDDSQAGKLDAANAKLEALGTTAAKSAKRVADVGDTKASLDGLERSGKNAGKALADVGNALSIGGAGDVGGGVGDIAEQLERAAAAGGMFKMGLGGTLTIMAAVGASAFSIGKAIGDIVWKTEYWNKQLEIAGQSSDRLTQKNLARLSRDFSQFMALEGTEEVPQYEARLKSLQTELNGARNNLSAAERQREKIAAMWWPAAGESDNAERAVRDAQAMVDLLEQQSQALQDMAGFQQDLKAAQEASAAGQREAAAVQAAKERLEILQATKDEQLQINAARQAATIDGQAELELLLRAVEINERRVEGEKAIARETQSLALMRKELTDGRDAAALMRKELELVGEGVERADAKRIAREQLRLQKQLEAKTEANKNSEAARDVPPLVALESRFLTSGRAADPNKPLIDELKRIREVQEANAKPLAQVAEAWYELAKRPLIYGAPGNDN